jgi:ABC-type multidrug transport system ATPase subunit
LPASPTAPASFDFDRVLVSEVSRHFGRRKALAKLSVVFEAGQLVGLLGPNGAGKSTLLSILATLAVPTRGEVRYGEATARQAGAEIRARLGSLGHDLYLYPELTARENLEFFARLYRIPDPGARVAAALARAGLTERADDLVSGFSRGMRQRLALERALLHGPRLVLLDEPFTGLDDASTHALVRRLAALRSEGAIVVLTTHDLDVVDGVIDRAVVLRDGRLAAETGASRGLREWYRGALGGGAAS